MPNLLSHAKKPHILSLHRSKSGPLALLVTMLCGACILPFLLAMLPLLLLWPLTLAVVSVSSWRKSRPSLPMHQLTRRTSLCIYVYQLTR